MKIVQCCFGIEHYIDTWGYQQNLLPLYCSKLGFETVVLASNDTYPSYLQPHLINEMKAKGDSYMNGQIRVERGPSYLPRMIHFQVAKNLISILEKESPDIVFFHGSFNLSLKQCVDYKKRHPDVMLYVDNHGDVLNVNSNIFFRFVYFKVFLSLFHHYCEKYVDSYFGVTQSRCDFLKDYIHIDPQKIDLLPIGADVDAASEIKEKRNELRSRYGFAKDDIVLVHGGKLDARKGTADLIGAYREVKKCYTNVKLVIFGRIEDPLILPLIDNDIVVYDWLSRRQTFELFKISNLAIWPIHHTTLIEDCVASNLPYLIRKTKTTQHLINSDFYLKEGNKKELVLKISEFIERSREDNKLFLDNVSAIKEKINYYTVAKRICLLSET